MRIEIWKQLEQLVKTTLRVALHARRPDANRGYEKTSLHVSSEVVRLPLKKHEARRTHYAPLCQVSSSLKLSHFARRLLCSIANCLAAVAPPYRFIGRAGRVSLPFGFVPFISVSRFEIVYRKSAMFGGGCAGSGGSVSATAFTLSYASVMPFCRISQIVSKSMSA